MWLDMLISRSGTKEYNIILKVAMETSAESIYEIKENELLKNWRC